MVSLLDLGWGSISILKYLLFYVQKTVFSEIPLDCFTSLVTYNYFSIKAVFPKHLPVAAVSPKKLSLAAVSPKKLPVSAVSP